MATSQVDTVTTGADKTKLAISALLIVAGFVAYFLLSAQGSIAQWAALLVGVAAGVALYFQTGSGRSLIGFGRDSVRELRKVVWPTRKETTQTTLFVFAFVVIMAMFLWVVDKLLEWILYGIVLGWR